MDLLIHPSRRYVAVSLSIALIGGASVVDAQSSRSGAGSIVRWSVGATPVFDSRASDQSDSALLLRPRGATRLPDGTVVVADDGAKNVKFFARDGRFVRSAGREGAGPGEYQLTQLVGACGSENILLYDGASQRLTTITQDGKLASTRLVLIDEPARRVPQSVSCSASKMLVILTQSSGPIPEGDVAFRSDAELRIQSIQGSPSHVLTKVPGPERHRFGNNAGPRPLGKRTLLAVGGDRIYIGTGDAPSIQVLTFEGTRLPDLRLPFRQERITSAAIRAYIERLIALNPRRSSALIRADYETVDYPEFFPLHGELLVDSEHLLWVEQYRQPGEDRSRWVIIDSFGRQEADIVLPATFRLLEVGAEYVLGTWSDEDDVLHVRMLQLFRGNASR